MDKSFELSVGQSKLIVSKPKFCPHCGIGIDATLIASVPYTVDRGGMDKYINAFTYIMTVFLCTACDRHFLTVNVHRRPTSGFSLVADRIFQYPSARFAQFDDLISKCSPGFVTLYESAYTSELAGHTRLAGAGYRMALEQLVKDYLINEDNRDADEITRLPLGECIRKFFSGLETLFVAADVSRILGNDYVHYQSKNPDIAFPVLRNYLDIFVNAILVNLKIKYPPVSRAVER